MRSAIPQPTAGHPSPGIRSAQRRAAPAFKTWLRRIERIYGQAALLDLHR